MKRILEVNPNPFIHGGIEAFITGFLQHIDKNDLHIDLVNMMNADNENYCRILKESGIGFYTLNLAPDNSFYDYFKALNEFLKGKHYDAAHIHVSSITKFFVLALALKLNGVSKVILHSHSTGTFPLGHYAAKAFSFLTFPFVADEYCACTYEAGKSKFPHYALKKLIVLRNGIDVEIFGINDERRKEYRKNCGFSDNDIIIGHAGRFSAEKNHGFLIDVFAELHKKSDRYKLLLIGNGENFENIKDKTENLGISDYVYFTGIVDNVNDYMQAMDVFALPSIYEGLPVVGVEAQACGLPFVVSTGVSKEVKLTENVEFVSIDDKSKWVEAIEKFAALPKTDNREAIKKAGYDIRNTAERIRDIYMEI